MGGMGRWVPNLSQDERDAVTRAMLGGMTAPEVVAAAAAGELEGLPPFNISETATRDLRAEAERALPNRGRGTNGAPGPGPPADQSEAAEREYLDEQIARLRSIKEPTADQFYELKAAMHTRDSIDRRAAKQAARASRLAGQEQSDEPSDFANRLLAQWPADLAEARETSPDGKTCGCDPPIVPTGYAETGGPFTCSRCFLKHPGTIPARR
jgi:hypothetical protein